MVAPTIGIHLFDSGAASPSIMIVFSLGNASLFLFPLLSNPFPVEAVHGPPVNPSHVYVILAYTIAAITTRIPK